MFIGDLNIVLDDELEAEKFYRRIFDSQRIIEHFGMLIAYRKKGENLTQKQLYGQFCFKGEIDDEAALHDDSFCYFLCCCSPRRWVNTSICFFIPIHSLFRMFCKTGRMVKI